jgi:hypothetical protein
MKLNRVEFLTAALALATATGCNKLKNQLGIAPEDPPPAVAQPATPAQPAAGNAADEAPVRPDTDTATPSQAARSPVKEGSALASPIKEAKIGASPVKETALASPIKEAAPSPVKEAAPSPVKEATYGSPVKEGVMKKPSPVKEM